VAMMEEFPHAARHQTHAVFMGLHFLRNADTHAVLPDAVLALRVFS
jgi:hypothetical protein